MGNPHVGEIRTGRLIGKPESQWYRKYVWQSCTSCGFSRWVTIENGKPATTLCFKCTRQVKGERSNKYKGGRIYQHGYIYVYLNDDDPYVSMSHVNRYVPEHRLVMSRYLGRCLNPDELVHHKDGIKTHNSIDNLELITRDDHITEHNKGYQDGYRQGYNDGQELLAKELKTQIKLLQWQICELTNKMHVSEG